MPCLVAHGIGVLTAVDKAHGEGREAQSAVVIGHRHGIVIVDGNGDKIIRVDCLQIFDGQNAQRTPAAPGARALLDDDTLARHKGGAHRGVADAHGNRPLYCGPQVVADVVALIGERQGGGQGKFVGIAVVERQTVECSRNGTARCVAEVSGKGADVTFGQECAPDGQLGFGGHVGQPAFHGKCSVETYADVVDTEKQAVVSLIDKGYPNGLAGIGIERQAVLVPLSVQIVRRAGTFGLGLPYRLVRKVRFGVTALRRDENLQPIGRGRFVGFRFPREGAARRGDLDGRRHHPGVGAAGRCERGGASGIIIGGGIVVLQLEQPSLAHGKAHALHVSSGRIAREVVATHQCFCPVEILEIADVQVAVPRHEGVGGSPGRLAVGAGCEKAKAGCEEGCFQKLHRKSVRYFFRIRKRANGSCLSAGGGAQGAFAPYLYRGGLLFCYFSTTLVEQLPPLTNVALTTTLPVSPDRSIVWPSWPRSKRPAAS